MTTGRSDLIDIAVTLVHETDKAWLFDHGGPENVWVAKSQGEYDPSDGTVALPEWLAKEKGMI